MAKYKDKYKLLLYKYKDFPLNNINVTYIVTVKLSNNKYRCDVTVC